jgi:hypothetical protein
MVLTKAKRVTTALAKDPKEVWRGGARAYGGWGWVAGCAAWTLHGKDNPERERARATW